MSDEAQAAVFDCNVYLQVMLRGSGAAHACWQRAVAGDAHLYVTSFIIAEIRRLPDHHDLRRFSKFTHDRVERFVEELLEVATLASEPPALFDYARDPDDAHYVNLAIATGAMLVVSNDKDLLDLMSEVSADGRAVRERYPGLRVLTPAQFLESLQHRDSGDWNRQDEAEP